jgi:uncharacterized membrane protein required for colicin V production
MNLVDVVIAVLVVVFYIEGLKRDFWEEFIDLLSVVLAFVLSLRFYNLLSIYYQFELSLPHSLANVLGFISIWLFIEALLFLLKVFLFRRKTLPYFKELKYITGLLSSLRIIAFVTILFIFLTSFPIQPNLKMLVSDSLFGKTAISHALLLEQPLKKVFGGLSQDTIAFFTVKPEGDESIKLGFVTTQFTGRPDLEERMIDLVNKERRSKGLADLKFDMTLRKIALEHSEDMFKRGYFSHYSPEGEDVGDRAKHAGYFYLNLGENLAFAPSLELAHHGLMNSPGHRANILSEEYNKIGIGIVDNPLYGIMITQVFSN